MNDCTNRILAEGISVSNDIGTSQYINTRASKSVSAILSMPVDEAWLFERGSAPRRAERYRLEKHYDICN